MAIDDKKKKKKEEETPPKTAAEITLGKKLALQEEKLEPKVKPKTPEELVLQQKLNTQEKTMTPAPKPITYESLPKAKVPELTASEQMQKDYYDSADLSKIYSPEKLSVINQLQQKYDKIDLKKLLINNPYSEFEKKYDKIDFNKLFTSSAKPELQKKYPGIDMDKLLGGSTVNEQDLQKLLGPVPGDPMNPYKWEDDDSIFEKWWKMFSSQTTYQWKNFKAGLSQWGLGITKGIDMLIPDEEIMKIIDPSSTSIIDAVLEGIKGGFDSVVQDAYKYNYDFAGDYGVAMGNIQQLIASCMPDFILTLITMGKNKAAAGTNVLDDAKDAAKAILTAIKTFSVSSSQVRTLITSVNSLIGTMAREMVNKPTFWTSFLREGGSSYDQAIANGASPVEASMASVIVGLLNAGVEVSGGLEAYNPAEDGVGPLVKWIRMMIDEGKEEVIQSYITNMVNFAISKGPLELEDMVSIKNPNALLNPVQNAVDFMGGAFVGGLLGGIETAGMSTPEAPTWEAYTDYYKTQVQTPDELTKALNDQLILWNQGKHEPERYRIIADLSARISEFKPNTDFKPTEAQNQAVVDYKNKLGLKDNEFNVYRTADGAVIIQTNSGSVSTKIDRNGLETPITQADQENASPLNKVENYLLNNTKHNDLSYLTDENLKKAIQINSQTGHIPLLDMGFNNTQIEQLRKQGLITTETTTQGPDGQSTSLEVVDSAAIYAENNTRIKTGKTVQSETPVTTQGNTDVQPQAHTAQFPYTRDPNEAQAHEMQRTVLPANTTVKPGTNPTATTTPVQQQTKKPGKKSTAPVITTPAQTPVNTTVTTTPTATTPVADTQAQTPAAVTPTPQAAPAANKIITKDDLDDILIKYPPAYKDAKKNIYDYFTSDHTTTEKINFLKQLYGESGLTEGNIFSIQNGSGISLQNLNDEKNHLHFTWAQVAKRVSDLIANGKYIGNTQNTAAPTTETKTETPKKVNAVTAFKTNKDVQQKFPGKGVVISAIADGKTDKLQTYIENGTTSQEEVNSIIKYAEDNKLLPKHRIDFLRGAFESEAEPETKTEEPKQQEQKVEVKETETEQKTETKPEPEQKTESKSEKKTFDAMEYNWKEARGAETYDYVTRLIKRFKRWQNGENAEYKQKIGEIIDYLENKLKDLQAKGETSKAISPSKTITQDDVDYRIINAKRGKSKLKINDAFSKGISTEEKIKLVKDVYATEHNGGSGEKDVEYTWDMKGLTLGNKFDGDSLFLSWSKIAKRITELVNENRYLVYADKATYQEMDHVLTKEHGIGIIFEIFPDLSYEVYIEDTEQRLHLTDNDIERERTHEDELKAKEKKRTAQPEQKVEVKEKTETKPKFNPKEQTPEEKEIKKKLEKQKQENKKKQQAEDAKKAVTFTPEIINHILNQALPAKGGKASILERFKKVKTNAANAKFLANEYGRQKPQEVEFGGKKYSYETTEFGMTLAYTDEKGQLTLTYLTWGDVASGIRKLVDNGQYTTEAAAEVQPTETQAAPEGTVTKQVKSDIDIRTENKFKKAEPEQYERFLKAAEEVKQQFPEDIQKKLVFTISTGFHNGYNGVVYWKKDSDGYGEWNHVATYNFQENKTYYFPHNQEAGTKFDIYKAFRKAMQVPSNTPWKKFTIKSKDIHEQPEYYRGLTVKSLAGKTVKTVVGTHEIDEIQVDDYTDDMVQMADYAKSHGMTLHICVGGIKISDKRSARGYRIGQDVVVQYDNTESPTDILMHEIAHTLVGTDAYKDIVAWMKSHIDPRIMTALKVRYQNTYEEAYGGRSDFDSLIEEEMVCDFLSNFMPRQSVPNQEVVDNFWKSLETEAPSPATTYSTDIDRGKATEDSYRKYSLNDATFGYAKKYTGVSQETQEAWDNIITLADIQKEFNNLNIKRNIHNINDFLSQHKDIWQKLVDIQEKSNKAGVPCNFVTQIQDTQSIEGQIVAAGLIGIPIEYKQSVNNKKYKFMSFLRSIPQMYIDSINLTVKEKIRADMVKAVEDAYEKNKLKLNFLEQKFYDAFPAFAELQAVAGEVSPSNIAGKTEHYLQAAVRGADKTVLAINLNSACPMFIIGNAGCYLDACYLTQMANGANGTNLFQSAIYAGEILQFSPDIIKAINRSGGLRVNGVGDTTLDNQRQLIDIIKHANMRGLRLKIITKQAGTFEALRAAKKAGLDISKVQVQPSLDHIWIPAKLDDIIGSAVKGELQITHYLTRGTEESATAIKAGYDTLGRETRELNGETYRKYGFTVEQINNFKKEFPEVNIKPRYVVCTANEIAELALNRNNQVLNGGKIIQTLMHGKVPDGCISDYPGKLLNFGGVRHVIQKNADGVWEFYGMRVTKDKGENKQFGIHTRVKTKAHKAVYQFVSENYTPEEQNTIWTNLKEQLCCQDNEFKDACAGCQSVCSRDDTTYSISTTETDENIGININDSLQNFTEQILNGEKTIETRNTNSLKPYIGKRIGIVSTGKGGEALVVGYATIGNPIHYTSEEQFRADESKHLVKKGSKYDIGTEKWGYPLSDIVREPNPYVPKGKGIRSRNIDPKYSIETDSDDNALAPDVVEFFKDSKIRDKNGNLLVVYHGSNALFTEFDTNRMGGLINFTDRKGIALGYATGAGGGRSNLQDQDKFILDWDDNAYDLNPDTGKWEAIGKMEDDIPDFKHVIRGQTNRGVKLGDTLSQKDLDTIGTTDSFFTALPKSFQVMQGYVNIKKPLDLYDVKKASAVFQKIKDDLDNRGVQSNTLNMILYDLKRNDGEHIWSYTKYESYDRNWQTLIVPELQELGYDGLILQDDANKTYTAFNPNQFKDIHNEHPSKNNDIRYSLDNEENELTPEQDEYFKNSKIRDEYGNLIKVYHGTDTHFDTFKYTQDIGFHFGTQEQATNIANLKGQSRGKAEVYSGYLNITNPLRTDDAYAWYFSRATLKTLVRTGAVTQAEADKILKIKPKYGNAEEKQLEAIKNLLKSKGYDGVVYANVTAEGNGDSYIVFDSKQFKRADNKNPTDTPDIRYSLEQRFYSKLEKVIENMKGNVMSTNGLVKSLLSNGVKQDEITWSTIESFLEGKKSVNKTELLDYLRNNKIKFVDSSDEKEYTLFSWGMLETFSDLPSAQKAYEAYMLDADDLEFESKIIDSDVGTNVSISILYPDEKFNAFGDGKEIGFASFDVARNKWIDVYGQQYKTQQQVIEGAKTYLHERAQAMRNELKIKEREPVPKYKDYATKGGSNYREILYTFPDSYGRFTKHHWGNKENVIAHTRLQDFTADDGSKVLFIDEVQSDWHEQGREKGYVKTGKPLSFEQRQELKKQVIAMIKRNDDFGYDYTRQALQELALGGLDVNGLDFESEEDRILARQFQEDNITRNPEIIKKVPDAPFKENWSEFVLKNILRYAAEGNYDRIAWTTGKQQADRYNLANYITRLEVMKEDDGKYEFYGYDQYDESVVEKYALTEAQLQEYIGKDLTRRVVNGENKVDYNSIGRPLPSRIISNHIFTGVDLTIGGEGMRNFYDIGGKSSLNIPRFLNKYGKQWDTQVDTVKINGNEQPSFAINAALKESVINIGQPLYSIGVDENGTDQGQSDILPSDNLGRISRTDPGRQTGSMVEGTGQTGSTGQSQIELERAWNEIGSKVTKDKGIGSRKTSQNQLARGLTDFVDENIQSGLLKPGVHGKDGFYENGAGLYDKNQLAIGGEDYTGLTEPQVQHPGKGITHYLTDPYNRSSARNQIVYNDMKKVGGVQVSAITNVLNVIETLDEAMKAIEQTYAPLVPGGKMLITVHEGDRSGVWDGSQHNRPLKWYEQFVQAVAPNALIETKNGRMIVTKPSDGKTYFPEFKQKFVQIGKNDNGYVYVHSAYIDQSNMMTKKQKAAAHLAMSRLAPVEKETFKFVAVQNDTDENGKERNLPDEQMKVQVAESPDFDTADEPRQGRVINFNFKGQRIPGSKLKLKSENLPVWHGKHLWVGEDYKGFDRVAAEKRFSAWKSNDNIRKARKITGKNLVLGRKDSWKEITDNVHIPELRYSLPVNTANIQQELYNKLKYLDQNNLVYKGHKTLVRTLAAKDIKDITPQEWVQIDKLSQIYVKRLKSRMFTTTPPIPKRAEVLTENPKEKIALSEQIWDAYERTREYFLDNRSAIETIGNITKDKYLYATADRAARSRAAAQYMLGGRQLSFGKLEDVGPSLYEIWSPIYKADKGKKDSNGKKDSPTRKLFMTYLYHMHNIDRMSLEQKSKGKIKNKPVFDDATTADVSRVKAEAILQQHPEFYAIAQQVWKYYDNLLQYRVDSRQISQSLADELRKTYPHYVKTGRKIPNSAGSYQNKTRTIEVAKTLGVAVGSAENLLPIDIEMALTTMQVVSAAHRNDLGLRLLNLARTKNISKFAEPVKVDVNDVPTDLKEFDDYVENQAFAVTNKNIFQFYEDGIPVKLRIDDSIFTALKSVSALTNIESRAETWLVVRGLIKYGKFFKKVTTAWSPTFLINNPLMDWQDVVFGSKNLRKWLRYFPTAIKHIFTNGRFWQMYKGMGLLQNSYFGYDKGFIKKKGKIPHPLEALNVVLEHVTRVSEFIASLNGNQHPNMNQLSQASLDSADITLNYNRGGTVTKFLNKTGIPYVNPQVQGIDKFIRIINRAFAGGWKDILRLLFKVFAWGILPKLINDFMVDWSADNGHPEVKECYDNDISKLDKDTKFLIPFYTDDGFIFVKIPMGRTSSIFGATYQRMKYMLKDHDPKAWDNYFDTVSRQILPSDVFTSNILAAGYGALVTGKNYMNQDIEPQWMQGETDVTERYDSRTDYVSRFLSPFLTKLFPDASPKRINYMLTQYLGSLAEYGLPVISPAGLKDIPGTLGNTYIKHYVLDPAVSNDISDEFYGLRDKYLDLVDDQKEKNTANNITSRFLGSKARDSSDMNAKIREIDNSSTLTPNEKAKDKRDLQLAISAMQKDATLILPKIEAAAKKYFDTIPKEDLEDDKKATKRMNRAYYDTIYDVYGAEAAIGVQGDDVMDKANKLKEKGVSFDDFYRYQRMTEYNTSKQYEGTDITIPNYEKSQYMADLLALKTDPHTMAVLYASQYETPEGKTNPTPYEKTLAYAESIGADITDIIEYEQKAWELDGDIDKFGKTLVKNSAKRDKINYLLDADLSDKTLKFLYESRIEDPDQREITKLRTAQSNGVPMREFLEVVSHDWEFVNKTDEFGNSIDNSAKKRAAEYILDMKTADKNKRWYFNNALGYSGDVVEFGKAKTLLQNDTTYLGFNDVKRDEILFAVANYYDKRTEAEKEELWQQQWIANGAKDNGVAWEDYRDYRDFIFDKNVKSPSGLEILLKWFQDNDSATLSKKARLYLFLQDAPNQTPEDANIRAAELAKIPAAQFIAYSKYIGTINAKDPMNPLESKQGLKKERIFAYVATLPLTIEQKAIMLYLTTESRYDELKPMTVQYIQGLNLSNADKIFLAQMIGLV